MDGTLYIDNNPESKPFWEAARAGRFVLPWCSSCGKTHWFPRGVCPHCLSTQIEWKDSPGEGAIYSYSVNRQGKAPSVLAYIALKEGPMVLSKVIDADPAALSIGKPVKVAFRPAEGELPIPLFRLQASEARP